MNPLDLAVTRFKPIRQAQEQIAKAEQANTTALVQLEELRAQIGPAERRDHEVLGAALIEGKAEPAPEAAKLKAELERQEQRVEALRLAVDRAHRQIPRLVDANRAGWRRSAMRELGRDKQRYEAGISEVEAAREALVDVATLITWLDRGELGEAANPTLDFPRTIEELRADVEHLAAHPHTRPDGPQPEPQIDIGQMRDGEAAASLWGGR